MWHSRYLLDTLLSQGTNAPGGAKQGKSSLIYKRPMSSKDKRSKVLVGMQDVGLSHLCQTGW